MGHGGGAGRNDNEHDDPNGFELLDEHIAAIKAGIYGDSDDFPPDVTTLAQERAYILKHSPDILGALKEAYDDKKNSFLPSALAGERVLNGKLTSSEQGLAY